MRLLHTSKLEFEEFFDDQIPRYAILSHRWGPDEVSYQDFLAGRKLNGAGYAKILACCEYATRDISCFDINLDSRWLVRLVRTGHDPLNVVSDSSPIDGILYDWVWVDACDWVWIDTCCIDKSSSADISEAINSMYDWYQGSHVCYAYLSDVLKSRSDDDETGWRVVASQWFTRGWTLQELIAPTRLIFLDQNWEHIGTRFSRKAQIVQCTGIAEDYIGYPDNIGSPTRFSSHEISIAERLSWASRRVTSRREDEAYCLMGLFAINIPLLYGEGYRAFDRLQREIIRSSSDESIFLWDKLVDANVSGGVLAQSAEEFSGYRWRYLGGRMRSGVISNRPPFAITNQGLEFRVPKRLTQDSHLVLPLNCSYQRQGKPDSACAILLKRISQGLWERVFGWHSWQPRQDALGGNVRHIGFSSVYVVPIDWVWSRESLAREESEVIYLKISR